MMKPSLRWIVIAGVALMVIAAVVYLVRFQNVRPGPPISNNTPLPSSPATNAVAPAGTGSNPLRTVADLPEEARKRFMWGYNRGLQELMPVQLYGRVVDQDGAPVAGVKITADVSSFDTSVLNNLRQPGNPKQTRIDVASNDAGLFSITGLRGFALHILGIKKDGYEADPAAQRWFNYSEHYGDVYQPDPASPLVFKMWKKGKSESLASMDKYTSIVCDGRNYTVDLLTGRVLEGATDGDLRIQVNVTPPTEITVRTYPWSCVIGVEDGGILESTDAFCIALHKTAISPASP